MLKGLSTGCAVTFLSIFSLQWIGSSIASVDVGLNKLNRINPVLCSLSFVFLSHQIIDCLFLEKHHFFCWFFNNKVQKYKLLSNASSIIVTLSTSFILLIFGLICYYDFRRTFCPMIGMKYCKFFLQNMTSWLCPQNYESKKINILYKVEQVKTRIKIENQL